jgi:hypothetical protein
MLLVSSLSRLHENANFSDTLLCSKLRRGAIQRHPHRKLRLGIDQDLMEWLYLQSDRLHLSPAQIVATLLEWARSEAVLEDLDLGVIDRLPEFGGSGKFQGQAPCWKLLCDSRNGGWLLPQRSAFAAVTNSLTSRELCLKEIQCST